VKAVAAAAVAAAALAALGAPHAGGGAGSSGLCSPATFTVDFDPRGSVRVTEGESTLALATFSTRSVRRACAGTVTTSPPHTPRALLRRTFVTCTAHAPLQIETHPVAPRGSQMIVSERGGSTWDVTAVVRPGGSRLYVYSDACKAKPAAR
jgi:hypothetical protein